MVKQRKQKASKAALTLFGIEAPPDIRIYNRTVLKTEWLDPEDDKPTAARTARTISGWRSYDPLRRSLHKMGSRSPYSLEHLEAADRLRLAYDGGTVGFSPSVKDGRPVHSIQYRPSQGPAMTAMRQLRAGRAFDAAWARFGDDDDTRAVLLAVVLKNVATSVAAERFGIGKHRLVELLTNALDVLIEHFAVGERERRRRAA
jgi:hypothetical protein